MSDSTAGMKAAFWRASVVQSMPCVYEGGWDVDVRVITSMHADVCA